MELKDFIKGTLIEIVSGVKEAQNTISDTGAYINPMVNVSNSQRSIASYGGHKSAIYDVDFDIAVTASDSSGAKGGIGVFLGGVGIGTKADLNETNVSQNRIKFQVPISYPLSFPNKHE
jgi:hypothetical protein